MKEKILASLKNRYKNLGLSEKILDGIADMLASTTPEESAIETAVGGVETLAKSFQSETDRIRTEATKAKADALRKEDENKKGGATEPDTTDMPAWAKGLMDANRQLTEKLTALESGKTTETRKSLLEETLKDAPRAFKNKVLKDFERMNFGTDDDFTNYLTDTQTDLSAVTQEIANVGLLARPVPIAGSGGKSKEPSKAELDSVMGNIM